MDNNQKKAVALGYEKEDGAPRVLAKGKGFVAENILKSAKEHGIPLVRDPETALALTDTKTGHYIPPELYHAVARIYAFLIEMDEDVGKMYHGR